MVFARANTTFTEGVLLNYNGIEQKGTTKVQVELRLHGATKGPSDKCQGYSRSHRFITSIQADFRVLVFMFLRAFKLALNTCAETDVFRFEIESFSFLPTTAKGPCSVHYSPRSDIAISSMALLSYI